MTVFGIQEDNKTEHDESGESLNEDICRHSPGVGMSLLWGLDFVVGVEGVGEGHCLRQGTFPGKCLLSVLGLRQFPEKSRTLLRYQYQLITFFLNNVLKLFLMAHD